MGCVQSILFFNPCLLLLVNQGCFWKLTTNMALEGSGPGKTAFKTACKKLTGTNVCSKNHIHIGILLCLWLQHPDGLPPIVTNFYLRQKISSKRMRDKAIDIKCKIETAGRFLENQWVKSLSFWDIEHQDLKVLPLELNPRMWAQIPAPLWENVSSTNLPISRHLSSRGLWKGTT